MLMGKVFDSQDCDPKPTQSPMKLGLLCIFLPNW